MTPQQSFIAAAIFLSSLVAVLLLAAVGEKLLNWISTYSGLAAWLQAIGALAIVYATYELHNSTRRELRHEANERKRIEKIKTKFFVIQNREIFGNIQMFLSSIEYSKTFKHIPSVKYPSVEYYRVVNRHLDVLTRSNSELSKLFTNNYIPDSCLGYVYEINFHLRQLVDQFTSTVGHSNIANTLKMIGTIKEINDDPLEDANADFLEKHLAYSVKSFDDKAELIRHQLEGMMNNIFNVNE